MEENQIFGAIIGGFVGFILALFFTSSKFTYLGGHWGQFEGGTGCFKTLIIQIICIGVGALIGIAVA